MFHPSLQLTTLRPCPLYPYSTLAKYLDAADTVIVERSRSSNRLQYNCIYRRKTNILFKIVSTRLLQTVWFEHRDLRTASQSSKIINLINKLTHHKIGNRQLDFLILYASPRSFSQATRVICVSSLTCSTCSQSCTRTGSRPHLRPSWPPCARSRPGSSSPTSTLQFCFIIYILKY